MIDAILDAIDAGDRDSVTFLALADALEEQGDLRSAGLRFGKSLPRPQLLVCRACPAGGYAWHCYPSAIYGPSRAEAAGWLPDGIRYPEDVREGVRLYASPSLAFLALAEAKVRCEIDFRLRDGHRDALLDLAAVLGRPALTRVFRECHLHPRYSWGQWWWLADGYGDPAVPPAVVFRALRIARWGEEAGLPSCPRDVGYPTVTAAYLALADAWSACHRPAAVV